MNKYLEQFFMLTEKNIEGDHNYYLKKEINKYNLALHSKPNKKKLVNRLVICMLFVTSGIGLSFFLGKLPHKLSLNALPLPSAQVNKVLAQKSSYIPGFREFAKRQILMNISLKKVELALLDEDELVEKQLDSKMLLMDKVIFVPKLFG